jgi:membrane fusion protein (multidrug efflux system)
MFIEARLATNIRPNAVVVPEDALLPMQGATFVWVVKDGKANQRPVSVGVRTAGWAEVQTGVDAGDSVVVGGLERLFPNAPVMARVVERHRGAPTGAESTATAAPKDSSKSR